MLLFICLMQYLCIGNDTMDETPVLKVMFKPSQTSSRISGEKKK